MKIANFNMHQSQLLKRLDDIEKMAANIKIELAETADSQTNILQDGLDYAKEQSDLSARVEIHGRYMREKLQILQALDRIEDGSFGECRECSDTIAAKRLLVQPSASLCVECQRQKEGHSRLAMAPIVRVNFSKLITLFSCEKAA